MRVVKYIKVYVFFYNDPQVVCSERSFLKGYKDNDRTESHSYSEIQEFGKDYSV